MMSALGFAGYRRIVEAAQDYVLGNFQPSLRDWFVTYANPGLRPGLLSAVPAGLVAITP